MKNRVIINICLLGVALLFATPSGYSQQRDSLDYYLEIAIQNNPLVNSNFALYKASLEKIPQAGAYQDIGLDIGIFAKPMQTFGGEQIIDFTLMQMFPWFGTRKVARNEATEMSRMSYEVFRDALNNLSYEVKTQWYQLFNLNEQYENSKENLALLKQMEQLALSQFSTASISSFTESTTPVEALTTPPAAGAMGAMGMATASTSATGAMSGMSGGGMKAMSGGDMKASSTGMSSVLRIQIEKMELENNLELIASNLIVAEARFNALLNRDKSLKISIPNSLKQLSFHLDDKSAISSIISRNPMLAMLDAEMKAYELKAEMDKKMGYPMFGVGLKYTVVGESSNPMVMQNMNGNDMFMPMVSITLPIFRKKYNAAVNESKYNRQASELKYQNTLNQLEAEYIAAKQQLANAIRNVNLYSKQYELLLSTYKLMIKEFAVGMTALSDVIQVDRQLRDYGLKKSEAITEYNTAIAQLEKLVAISLND